jgi:hypothetical protein
MTEKPKKAEAPTSKKKPKAIILKKVFGYRKCAGCPK